MYKLETKKPSTLILIKLLSSPSIGAVLFTPGIPAIMQYFGVSTALVQLTLTLFLVGYAAGQLFYAPIANRWGRRFTISVGMAIAVLGSVLVVLSAPLHSFLLLLIGRVVMALGSSVGLVLTFTIINDFYFEHQARKVVPIVSLAFAVVPFVGIMIGGFLVHFLDWVSCFYFLGAYNLLVLFLCRFLPETGTHFDREATRVKQIIQRYIKALKDTRLAAFSTLFGFTTAIIYLFAAAAPIIVIRELGIHPGDFGVLNLIVAGGYVIGNLLSASISKHMNAKAVMILGYVTFAIPIIVFSVFCYLGLVNLYTLYIPFFLVYVGLPLSFSNAAVLGTTHYEDRPSGASIMMFINIFFSMLGVLILGFIPGSIFFTFPLVLIIDLIVYLSLFFYAKRLV